MVGNEAASSDDDAHAQHTHTATSDDDVLSHSPAGVCREKADAITIGESTVEDKLPEELGSPARVCQAKADAIASGESTVGDKLREELGDLLSVLRGVDVLKALSDLDLSKLCDSLLRCVIPAGEIVMRQGERSSTFYLIVRGTATVARSEAPGEPEKVLLHLGRLSYFGERALLSNEPRAATIRAESELELLYIQREAFEAILGQLSTISLRTTRRRSQLARAMLSSCDTQAVTEMEAGSSAVAFHLQGDREMYTEENLGKRFAVRNSPPVMMALVSWWRTCSNDSGAQDDGYIPKKVYMATFMKVYRALSNDFIPAEARATLEEEWEQERTEPGPNGELVMLADAFLDCIARDITVDAAASSFILNPSYDTLLTDAQLRIKRALEPLHALMQDESVTGSHSWAAVERVLSQFGAPEFAKNDEVYS